MIDEVALTPKDKAKADLIVRKNAWCKTANNTLKAMVAETEALDQNKKKIDLNAAAIGPKVMLEWKKQAKGIVATKESLKSLEHAASDKDPHWHNKQEKTLESFTMALKDYRKAKDNCLRCISMC